MPNTALEFTRSESAALDREIRRLRGERETPPLRPEPALWAAFAEERATTPSDLPRPRASVRQSVPSHCSVCLRPMRNKRATIADEPGTVRHEGRGVCHPCTKTSRARRARHTKKELANA